MTTETAVRVFSGEITPDKIAGLKELSALIHELKKDSRRRLRELSSVRIEPGSTEGMRIIHSGLHLRSLQRREQEILAKVIHQPTATGREARKLLIAHSYALVVWTTKKLCWHHHPEFPDLFQSGMEGLIKAVDKFDPALGFAFGTFASRKIYGEALFHRQKRCLYRPTRQNKVRINKLRELIADKEQKGRSPANFSREDVAFLAQRLKVSPSEIWDMIQYISQDGPRHLSVNYPGLAQNIYQALLDNRLGSNQVRVVELSVTAAEEVRYFRSEFNRLDIDDWQRRVFEVVYGLDGGPCKGKIDAEVRRILDIPDGVHSYNQLYGKIKFFWKKHGAQLPLNKVKLKEAVEIIRSTEPITGCGIREVWL